MLYAILRLDSLGVRNPLKGAVHAPVGDWSRRPIPMGLFLVIDLDELSKLLAYEKSLSTIVSEISSLKVTS